MEKLIFIDLETTGLELNSGVYQISGIVECGKRVEEFNFFCDIFEDDLVDPKSFEVNGMSLEKLAKLPNPAEIHEKFLCLLDQYVDKYNKQDKFTLIAYAAHFDEQRLREWFKKNDDDYFGSWFWFPSLCVMRIAAFYYRKKRKEFPNFKLETVAKHMGIVLPSTDGEDKGFHDAMFDARTLREMYHCLRTWLTDDIPF